MTAPELLFLVDFKTCKFFGATHLSYHSQGGLSREKSGFLPMIFAVLFARLKLLLFLANFFEN